MRPEANLKCNSAQKSAIEHFEGPACVIAGPGSGKTFVIIQRILNLIRKGVSPGSILTITFTKAAAIEMQQRFIKETDSEYPEVLFGTFHSIFYHILDNKNYSILKEPEKYRILGHILQGKDYDSESMKLVLSEISRLKNTGDVPENCDKSVPLENKSSFACSFYLKNNNHEVTLFLSLHLLLSFSSVQFSCSVVSDSL